MERSLEVGIDWEIRGTGQLGTDNSWDRPSGHR